MVRWIRQHCPPDTGFEIWVLTVCGLARYLRSATESPHNTNVHEWAGGGGGGHLFLWNMNARGSHLHLSSYLVPTDSLISHICAMSIRPLSSLANSDNPDTLHTVNRWRHNEYSCCAHPSFSYSFHRHLLSRSDQGSDCQTGCGKMDVVGGEAAIYNFTHMQL